MINLDTILSAFDDKFTLMKWLKQVEKALLDGVLTNASIVDNRDGQFKIKFTFADGTTQETNAIKVFDVETLFTFLEGSESVVVDINESNTALEIHLDAEVMAKIENALQLPKTRPTEQELVGVDATGAQNRLTINELKALLGGGGGTKLYKHRLYNDLDIELYYIISLDATPLTYSNFNDLQNLIVKFGIKGNSQNFLCYYSSDNKIYTLSTPDFFGSYATTLQAQQITFVRDVVEEL